MRGVNDDEVCVHVYRFVRLGRAGAVRLCDMATRAHEKNRYSGFYLEWAPCGTHWSNGGFSRFSGAVRVWNQISFQQQYYIPWYALHYVFKNK
jgi:hypothetical protein